jgi:hypothetical protein
VIDSPCHGKLNCKRCFATGESVLTVGPWRLRNDPGHWGSINPKVLVLGFSKGSTQADVYANGRFEDVPFAECRTRLASILRTLGLLADNDSIDAKFTANEVDFGFASLIRCSLARWNDKSRSYRTSGQIIKQAFEEETKFIHNCVERYASGFPERLKLIVMLGIDDAYIENCRKLFSRIHDIRPVNEVAYTNGRVTWVHATHPSPANGHFTTWLTGDATRTAISRKRELAKEAVFGIGQQKAQMGLAFSPPPAGQGTK